jgi:hypothetical protein
MQANIAAQQRQLALAEIQSKAVFKNDSLGQLAGFVICLDLFGMRWRGSLFRHQ